MSVLLALLAAHALAGPPDLQKADALDREVMTLRAQSKSYAALKVAEKAVALREKALGKEHPDLARFYSDLAGLRELNGDYLGARALLVRVVAIQEKAKGPDAPETAWALQRLGISYWYRGDLAAGEPILLRGLEIFEKRYGRDDTTYVASYVETLAGYYRQRYDYARAEQLFRRALAIREKASGPDDPALGSTLFQLAWVYLMRGDLAGAEAPLKRILALYDKAKDPTDLTMATFTDQLGALYEKQGRREEAKVLFARSEAAYRRVLAAKELEPGPKDAMLAMAVERLASHLVQHGKVDEAEPLYRRWLALMEKAYGADNIAITGPIMSLAGLHDRRHEWKEARRLYRRARDLQVRALGPRWAVSMDLLMALDYRHEGKLGRAETLYRSVLADYEARWGPSHPNIVGTLDGIASLAWARGDLARAVSLYGRGQDIMEPHIALVLATGSEADKRAFLDTQAHQVDVLLSLDLVEPKALATPLALTTLLRRKGRVLDAVTDTFGALRRRLDGEGQALLEKLAEARSQLAQLVLGGSDDSPERAQRLAELEEEVRRLEAAVGRRSADFRLQTLPVTAASVAAAVPADAVLLELCQYRRMEPRRPVDDMKTLPRHYAAYVLRRGAAPIGVDLGPSEAIDADVAALRQALASPLNAEVKALARAVYDRLRPALALAGASRHVYVAPDGALNLVPFGALVDESGHYLVERLTFTYLTSGRDLLRQQAHAPRRHGPVIVANPDFDGGGGSGAPGDVAQSRGRRSLGIGSVHWASLPGTADEVSALRKLLPDAQVLTGGAATETALKAVAGPIVLHVATHGFFLPSQDADGVTEAQRSENPLLRSGLVLSGVHRLASGADDGILTALEASGLDLHGTELVVLSACETGVGDVASGDGVYGLRRALVIAGSESQLMSLWQVDDAATRELMVSIYQRLGRGMGRSEAVRQSQLRLLEDPEHAHPYFWAAFIPSGQAGPMGR